MPFQRQPTAAETAASIFAQGVPVVDSNTDYGLLTSPSPFVAGTGINNGGVPYDTSKIQSLIIDIASNVGGAPAVGDALRVDVLWYAADGASRIAVDTITMTPFAQSSAVFPARGPKAFVQITVISAANTKGIIAQIIGSQRVVDRPTVYNPDTLTAAMGWNGNVNSRWIQRVVSPITGAFLYIPPRGGRVLMSVYMGVATAADLTIALKNPTASAEAIMTFTIPPTAVNSVWRSEFIFPARFLYWSYVSGPTPNVDIALNWLD